MLNVRSLLAALTLLLLVVNAAPSPKPQNRRPGGNGNGNGNGRGNGNGGGNGRGNRQTAQQQAARVPQGISEATDGSTILDMTAEVNGLPLRFRVSMPADQFVADSPVNTANPVAGAAQTPGAAGTMGLNVLLHGDGGQSFFDFPNQAAQANLAGGLDRTDGVAHAQAVAVTDASAAALTGARVHFQTTTQELDLLQGAIPAGIQAYEDVLQTQGLSADQINALQTVDGTPNGGHCAFDGQDFVSGVQLMADNYASVMQAGGSGEVAGIGNVKTGVVGNENVQFTGANRRSMVG
ncbi:Sphingosine-1-phosphate lyase [Verticillium dahliae VDG1]|nr:Sphingosine-1-phosphate lyase [Verticillium dahliae VDG1]